MTSIDYKIAIGQAVRDRLAANPAVLKLPSNHLDIFIARNLLTHDDCAGLIRLIDARRAPSQVLAPSDDPDYRTSESCDLDPRHPLVQRVEAKIQELLGIEASHGETIQGQRYAVGQQFKPHQDFFHADQPYWEAMEASGGQRTWTAMAFLNVPEGGGQTAFPEIDVKVAPRAGNLLVWNNMDANGLPNTWSLHQGLPVTAGVKYVITKWHRERPWGAWAAPTY